MSYYIIYGNVDFVVFVIGKVVKVVFCVRVFGFYFYNIFGICIKGRGNLETVISSWYFVGYIS